MREILFKAKRKDNNEWVYGNLVDNYIIEKECFYECEEYNCFGTSQCCEIIPETLSQYTGLTDKNGVKIFENDIIKNDRDTSKVVYNPRGTKFALHDNEMFIDQCDDTINDCDDIEEKFIDDKYFGYSCVSYEVIGNIFDEEVQ